MPAGDLKYLVNLLKPNATRDASGQMVPSTSEPWKRFLRKLSAKFVEVSGGEGLKGAKVEANTTAIVLIRYLRGVSKEMRVELHDGADEAGRPRFRYFEIISVLDRTGKERWTEIQCSEVV